MNLPLIAAGLAVAGTVLYAVFGGADFGGGVWDLLATGVRARAQRELVARAVAPIWEANHVWLIFVIVVLFVCFPSVYATIGIALHVPLSLMLVGIVLRGAAFAFRSHDYGASQRRWDAVFAVSSVVSPIMLGVCVGAVASGDIRVVDGVVSGTTAWWAPFPALCGVTALCEFAHLAAAFLVFEAKDDGLRRDFQLRAAVSGVVGLLAVASCTLAMRSGAPLLWSGLVGLGAAIPLVFAVMVGSTAASATGRAGLARVLATARVVLIVTGWAAAQFPFLVVPDLVIATSAAPEVVLEASLLIIGAGSLLLVPAFIALYTVFKSRVVAG